ncbi:MAG: UDP-N-acetylmuramoyl-L-alanyl-D-glutamate--2,6-diaminopimelate ligase [Actinobacteria bacterium]|nr:UDP-N-acetylmuramoyl-L-alanyl-D-glutamate--2,6-diaminopimelate ligase [Actinomycetota bacterium]
MRLDAVLDSVDVRATRGDIGAVDVTSVTLDSSAVRPGALFCCVRGATADGHDFAGRAVSRGATAVMGERFADIEADVPQAVVDATRPAMAAAAAALHGHPSRSLTVIGVTGTNGKTTTTYLLQAILDAAGRRCGVVGSMTSARTTPEAPALQADLARFRDDGYAAAAIEVSSAAIIAHRVDAIAFAAGVFTNLGRDHLGEVHATMDDYFEAKAALFTPERVAAAVVNADDEWGRRLLDRSSVPTASFSITDAAELEVGKKGSRFIWRGHTVELALPGRFNVANALAAATTAEFLGVAAHDIVAGLHKVTAVPGRFEWVDAGQPFSVAVDYAHTPEALEQALLAARELAHDGRVILVFGCGGGRDRGKRAPMGRAARLADVAVLTSDNPRDENPQAIIADVLAGANDSAPVDSFLVEPDRARAITVALDAAEPGDVVLIAGKGHETGQEIAGQVIPFDDRDIALAVLRAGAR